MAHNHEEILNKVHEALEAKELNFEAKMAETYALVNGVYVPTGSFTPVRTDKTGPKSIITGKGFSDHYTPIQNEEAFSVLGEMADIAEIEFVNVGSWGNGSGIFAQISIGDAMEVGPNKDRVGKYISLVNSHDGTRALQLLVTPFRFFCQNQISKAIKDATKNNRLISIHHNIYGAQRLQELAHAVTVANDIFTDSEENYKRLADRKVTMNEVREVMARCLPLPTHYWRGVSERTEKLWEKHIGEMVQRFQDADNGNTEKMTGWNLYNAVQGWNQHNTKKTATYEKSLLLGKIANFSENSLSIVNSVLFEGDNAKTSSKEFDEIFKKVA